VLSLSAEQRLALRQRLSERLIDKLHQYLLELQPEVLPKSPAGAAVRYELNQWEALTRFLKDGELEIDNGATERANRTSHWAAATGHFLVATVAARRRRYCELSLRRASGAGLSRSPGSATCSRASRHTPSPG